MWSRNFDFMGSKRGTKGIQIGVNDQVLSIGYGLKS